MASVERLRILGGAPSCSLKSRLEARRVRLRALRLERNRKPDKPDDFVAYDNSDEDAEESTAERKFLNTSYSFIDYLNSREFDLKEKRSVCTEYPTRYMISHELFKEYPICLNNMNKVFCSQWLSDRQIVFGTKCNKLMVYDVVTRKLDQIPLLRGRREVSQAQLQEQGGIHCAKINPSRTLLATGAKNANEIAVYRLPTMDPLCVGENAHKDWVFDVCWLDDEFLVSGSRDSKMALWRVVDDDGTISGQEKVPHYSHLSPFAVKQCKSGQKVRALAFNRNFKEIAALSLNGYVHVWNAETFKQMYSRKLPSNQENVCIAVKEEGLYGIGCRSYTLLLDPRTLHPVKKISAKFTGCGVRCASFQGDILTIGTGLSMLMFYDLRAQKYLESSINSSRTVNLKCSRGYVFPDEEFMEQQQVRYTPAIYTHCYDLTGTRIFAAGGPLPATIYGNYAGIWQ